MNNDDFANRIALYGFSIGAIGTNIDFTGELGELNHAGISSVLNSAWWTWEAPASGEVTINTFGSDYDTSLAVYTGNGLSSLNEIASNDDYRSLQSQVVFTAEAGTIYQISVDGYGASTGNIDLNLNLIPTSINTDTFSIPINNDDFANRIALSGTNISAIGTNIDFTGEVNEPNHAGISGVLNSAWWTWEAPASGDVTINTFGSGYDTSLAVYTGDSLTSLSAVAGNDDAVGLLQSQVIFNAEVGTTYQIAVDGYSTSVGSINLNLALEGGPISNPEPVDLILDFDGGLVQAGQGYDIPTENFNGFNFSAFTPFDQSDNRAGNLNEQIFQIIAGVREDFANFNVRVIWDNQGVNSQFFDNRDTVVMVVGDSAAAVGQGNIMGIAANVDAPQFTGSPLQSRRDTGFAFQPAHVGIGLTASNEIRELIDTISHEAGHTFGLSHSTQQDSENRQLVTTAGQNLNLDSRFSAETLNHGAPETGIAYAETTRLNDAVGAASILPGDIQSSQTLLMNPTTPFVGTIDTTDQLTAEGRIDFLGDRDAFRFETLSAGRYTIQQLATTDSLLNPVLTLWDAEGDFIAVGSGSNNTITFQSNDNGTYYAIAGSDVDRLMSGSEPLGQIGEYTLQFGVV